MYSFDASRRPLYVLRMRTGAGPTELDALQRDIDALVERAEPFAIIFDIAEVSIPPREQVMKLLAWNKDMRGRYIRTYDQAVPPIPSFAAYHMPSMLGNLLRFFQQMLPASRGKQRVCTTFEEALSACEDAILEFEFESSSSRHAG